MVGEYISTMVVSGLMVEKPKERACLHWLEKRSSQLEVTVKKPKFVDASASRESRCRMVVFALRM